MQARWSRILPFLGLAALAALALLLAVEYRALQETHAALRERLQ